MTWRKSSYSGQAGNCVQIRSDLAAVRDSKNETGSALAVPTLHALLQQVKTGRFDR
jgi:hypothetical protein